MYIETSVQPFSISRITMDAWDRKPHQHNFFELVYIEDGEGEQCINHTMVAYAKGNIFLLPPFDCHSFFLKKATTFIFIRFNSLFFQKDNRQMLDYTDWFANLHFVLSSYNRKPGDIIHSSADRIMLDSLIRGIYEESVNNRSHADSILRAHMFAVLNILARNMEFAFAEEHQETDVQIRNMLQYIQYNLFDNEKLRVGSLAREFNLSPTYVSEYFKKKAGESLKEYILKSRVNVAKSRLNNSDQRAAEIAEELGFADTSHMNRVIKKYDQASAACRSQPSS